VRLASDSIRELTASAEKVIVKFDESVGKVNKTADAATETVKATQARIDEISKAAIDRMADLSRLMEQANTLTAKINDGQGTAGRLVNDPKLYEGLVDTTTQLNTAVQDLQRVLQQWEQEGVTVKLR
jgi:phospholipid/cholesterol/gamma-HCH transport system substrate-binding protein